MNFSHKTQTANELVRAWQGGSTLVRNPEYQRGEAWSRAQKQAFVDSLFRRYPIPAIFLERKRSDGLFGEQGQRFEIIDGQQRILALDGFYRDEYELLRPADHRLRLPHSLRSKDEPWGGHRYSQLDSELRRAIDGAPIDVYLVEDVENSDEVRDLFIRLQPGTALTRQQIRDAWPGSIGPLVETFAGKLAKHPRYRLFAAVDGRGIRDDEDDPRDPYVKHRQTCAQLLRVLVARMSDPRHFPSVQADDIDAFYHDQTKIDPQGPMVGEIEGILARTQQITELLRERGGGKRKVPKLSLFALALFFQDMQQNPWFRFDDRSAGFLADYAAAVDIKQKGRAVSGPAIRAYYDEWLAGVPEGAGIRLDEKRSFDEADRRAIWERARLVRGVQS